MTWLESIFTYFQLGFSHVIPLGFDHILFILTLFFLSSNIKTLLIQCSVFTLAHSLSLGLAALGLIIPNATIVEPLIALSILFTAIENIVHDKINPWRLVLIFGFGLIHGLGFAKALNENDEVRLLDLLKKSSLNLMIVSGIVFLIINLNLNDFYLLINQEGYASATGVVIIVSIGKLFSMSMGCLNNIISNSKYYSYVFWFSVSSAVLAVFLNQVVLKYCLWMTISLPSTFYP